jgi:hypothetical protein
MRQNVLAFPRIDNYNPSGRERFDKDLNHWGMLGMSPNMLLADA